LPDYYRSFPAIANGLVDIAEPVYVADERHLRRVPDQLRQHCKNDRAFTDLVMPQCRSAEVLPPTESSAVSFSEFLLAQ